MAPASQTEQCRLWSERVGMPSHLRVSPAGGGDRRLGRGRSGFSGTAPDARFVPEPYTPQLIIRMIQEMIERFRWCRPPRQNLRAVCRWGPSAPLRPGAGRHRLHPLSAGFADNLSPFSVALPLQGFGQRGRSRPRSTSCRPLAGDGGARRERRAACLCPSAALKDQLVFVDAEEAVVQVPPALRPSGRRG
jgi:hypothetical protein